MEVILDKRYEARALAAELVAEATLTDREIAKFVEAMMDLGHCQDTTEAIEEIVARAAEKHRRKEKDWQITANDKLDRAFELLELDNILARQNYQTSEQRAHDAIAQEIGELSKSRQIDGYVFYHGKDTALVRADRELFLTYRGVPDEPATSRDIRRRVIGALRKAGHNPAQYAATGDQRVRLFGFFWQRRRQNLAA